MNNPRHLSSYRINVLPKIKTRNAFHLAGRIAGSYFRNALNNLPPVHFQVRVQPASRLGKMRHRSAQFHHNFQAILEGGRLISDLPPCYQKATQRLTETQKQQCLCAFEADVVNLLAGPLAEAKYVAQRDGEVFNANLVYLGALKFYGGTLDLLTVEAYLGCLYPDDECERNRKLAELFLAAYSFVNAPGNWRVITALADSLQTIRQDVISYQELIALMHPEPMMQSYQPVINEKLGEALVF